jgi:hypothetical protein
MTVVRYLFEMLAELRRNVATLTRAWDDGQLSARERFAMGLALDLIWLPGYSPERIATAMAIIGAMAEEHAGPYPQHH